MRVKHGVGAVDRSLMKRTISTERYEIASNPRSPGAYVELKLVRRAGMWELNGEPMTAAGEVIANIGLVMEHLDRELERTLGDAAQDG